MDFIMYKLFLILLFCFFVQPCFGGWFSDRRSYNAYCKKDYKAACDILELNQVEDPTDIFTNYNLGVLYYKLGKLDEAKNNFDRAAEIAFEKNKKMAEQSYFNLGNCFVKEALQLLGDDWETKELDGSVIKKCKSELVTAIGKFKNILAVNKNNTRAKDNIKKTEELLKKLEEQEKQHQKDKQKDQKDKSDKQDKSSGKNKKNDKQAGDQQNNRNDRSDERNKSKQDGENKKSQSNKAGDNNEDNFQHGKNTPEEQKGDQQKSSYDQNMNNKLEKQEGEQKVSAEKKGEKQLVKQEDMEMKGLRVMLDQLQKDESKLQKMIMKTKNKNKKNQSNSVQKQW
jgi:Ca-activated chloride channel homolog